MKNTKVHKEEVSLNPIENNQKSEYYRQNSDRNQKPEPDHPQIPQSPSAPKKKIYSLINSFLDHWSWSLLMLLITIFALFADDFRLAVTKKSSDDGFSASMIVCLILFTIEIILAFITKPEYRFSFFFWLDVLSTVSLIFDINWIWNAIQGKVSSNLVQSTQIARASRASRAGTRAARIIRVIRVIRLIRIVKLYKLAQSKVSNKETTLIRSSISCRGFQNDEQVVILEKTIKAPEIQENSESQNFDSFGNKDPAVSYESYQEESLKLSLSEKPPLKQNLIVGDEKQEIPQESKVGKKLSELTTMRVIIVVLVMILILPFFNINMYREIDSYQMGLQIIDNYISDSKKASFLFNEYVDKHKNQTPPLIYLEVTNTDYIWESHINPDSLRDVEINIITLNVDSDYKYFSYAIFDLSSETTLQAGMSMLKTFFICFVLTAGSIMFSKDTNELVLEPLENMIRTVKNIAKNPLLAVQEEEKNQVMKESALESKNLETQQDINKNNSRMLETEMLEQLIIKIGALMALGFGEAGSEIIAKNMQQSKGEVDPLVPGKQQLCIFGFCDIRQFANMTEILEQDIMIYVNEIAAVVHQSVDECLGATNRNLGDVFVLVWKFPDEVLTKDRGKNKILIQDHPFIAQFADMALISYIKIIGEINSNGCILKYNENPQILEKLPNFKVKMGFGLHFGWGIEGAIGSEYKIDASYLSPHVNLASRLCAATKQYGVWMLISEYVQVLMSDKMKKLMRRCDRCTFKGSAQPMDIYTVDIDCTKLEIYSPKTPNTGKSKKRARVTQRLARDEMFKDLWSGTYKAVKKLKDDYELSVMVTQNNSSFYKVYEEALEYYLSGDWGKAKEKFEEALKIKYGDGPCINMLTFIEDYGGVAPSTWPGYRKLLEK
ncbi:hypothetical protein SteCoe_12145 [Stentor coeruleus]|uniref:Guanylate cyclase domain-containing protein n=1 Tax=Stentor coeruleus TaxID=5963 RepID=A0A1R2CBI0_9CILI|nr:hypothetical protein SteCoe_12145 [Stentor coeruleus]